MSILLRVAVTGTGRPGDKFTPGIPFRALHSIDYAQKLAIVEVDDDDFPEAIRTGEDGVWENLPQGRVLTGVTPAGKVACDAHYDDRYQERAGEFRPDLE